MSLLSLIDILVLNDVESNTVLSIYHNMKVFVLSGRSAFFLVLVLEVKSSGSGLTPSGFKSWLYHLIARTLGSLLNHSVPWVCSYLMGLFKY